MEENNKDLSSGEDPKDKAEKVPENNDNTGYDDDTIGENTELTPLAAAIKKDEDAKVQAKENTENKDFSEKNG
jgi:hypothetical protein